MQKLHKAQVQEAAAYLQEELQEETNKFLDNPSVQQLEQIKEIQQELYNVLEELVLEYAEVLQH